MNQELIERIIAAVVVTALAAIFIPMLFDDPVEDSEQIINPLEIPEQQFSSELPPASTVPENMDDVVSGEERDFESTGSELSDQEMMAEPPADEAINEEEESTPASGQAEPAVKKPVPVTSKPASQTSKAKPTTTKKTQTQNPDLKRWYLQAGSFSKQSNAQSLADKLKKQGMPVFMETIKVPGKGTFYRLRIGPELDKNRARAMQKTLSQQKINALLLSE